jgi:hypothetical protein
MNSSTPVIRLGLFALTGAMILGTAALYSNAEHAFAGIASAAKTSTALATVTLPTISVRASAEEIAAANATVEPALPVLPTIHVRPTEEEVIAARIDPTDRIQILSTIHVYPDAQELAAAMQPALNSTSADADEETGSTLGMVLSDAVAQHHRLRLDMPYYSFGKVLTRAPKN